MINTFFIILPLFVLMAGGMFFARLYSLSEETLSRGLTDFFMPLLVFVSLYESDIHPQEMLAIAGAAVFMVFFMLIAGVLYCKAAKTAVPAFAMPVVFMNSGFLGIPLMQLWGGTEAMNYIVIYDEVQTLFLFTLGLFMAQGGISLKKAAEAVKSPILWAVLLGFACNIWKIPLPAPLISTFHFGGAAAPPLAAFTLGCSLRTGINRLSFHTAAGVLLRTAVGFCSGLAAAWLFNLQGTAAVVVIVAGALPAAVFSYVLPARYGAARTYTRDIVVLSTLLSIITIPGAFYAASLL